MTAFDESVGRSRNRRSGVALGDAAARAIATGAWERPAIVAVGFLAAILYVWNLTVSGFAKLSWRMS